MKSQQSQTVLIVDDEELVRMVGADILRDGGYQVLEASCAADALACLERCSEVMVLFTDINMPGTPDGFGLAQLVHDRWPQVKILSASGRVRPEAGDLPDKGLFLSKPYRAEELLARVEALTERWACESASERDPVKQSPTTLVRRPERSRIRAPSWCTSLICRNHFRGVSQSANVR